MKDLKDQAIDIKGKMYVPVSARIVYFNDSYDQGMIHTEILTPLDSPLIIIKATVYPDAKEKDCFFTGHSQAVIGEGYINKTAALENAETSAVGRALAMMGIGVIESVASSDEVVKATNEVHYEPVKQDPIFNKAVSVTQAPTEGKVDYVEKLTKKPGNLCIDCKKDLYVLNPKTQKVFCSGRCWTKKGQVVPPPTSEYGESPF